MTIQYNYRSPVRQGHLLTINDYDATDWLGQRSLFGGAPLHPDVVEWLNANTPDYRTHNYTGNQYGDDDYFIMDFAEKEHAEAFLEFLKTRGPVGEVLGLK